MADFQIKTISSEAVPAAMERAEHYRLLNEPMLAESICLDVLAVAPNNQKNLVCLILAITDQFSAGVTGKTKAALKEYIGRLSTEYQKAYYTGLVSEREARAVLEHSHSNRFAYEGFREAMEWYEKAEQLSPPGNDEAKLRYNTCVRWIERAGLTPAPSEEGPQFLE